VSAAVITLSANLLSTSQSQSGNLPAERKLKREKPGLAEFLKTSPNLNGGAATTGRSALELRSTGKRIAPNFVRPYAICRTRPFLPKGVSDESLRKIAKLGLGDRPRKRSHLAV
jgi:hypothetical protein